MRCVDDIIIGIEKGLLSKSHSTHKPSNGLNTLGFKYKDCLKLVLLKML